ncbi:Dehydrodolichyl diphosphate synthase complex subunit Dhdds [Lamellibrachia satsuma]|nr:Dehydrodolichyl diphosphate synthase complex subunit Dhdds [Lamellibrachia satsuma]
MRELAEGVQMGHIRESDISEELLHQCLYTNKSPDPDLVLRTSGEVRLSDFLLWQSTFSILSFMKVLWPEFTDWDLRAAVIYFQKNYDAIQKNCDAIQMAKRTKEVETTQVQKHSDYACVQEEIEQERAEGRGAQPVSLQERLRQYAVDRQCRTQNFISTVDAKRDKFFDDIYRSIPVTTCTH